MRESAGRKKGAMYCVIVGDIINSKEIVEPEKREAILRAARSVFSSINAHYRDALLADFGVVRGDGFEGVLTDERHVPQIIRRIIEGLYAAERTCVRIAAVTGELSVISGDRNECDGPAFHRALELLEALKRKKSRHWMQVAYDSDSQAQPLIDSLLGLMSVLTGGWTEKQRDIVWAMEKHHIIKSVASQLGIKPSVVSKQLRAANHEEYRMAWESLEIYLRSTGETNKAAEHI